MVKHYMRGGRHITDGSLRGDGRKNPYKDDLIQGFDLTAYERRDLIDFLKALTDRTLIQNPQLTDPH